MDTPRRARAQSPRVQVQVRRLARLGLELVHLGPQVQANPPPIPL